MTTPDTCKTCGGGALDVAHHDERYDTHEFVPSQPEEAVPAAQVEDEARLALLEYMQAFASGDTDAHILVHEFKQAVLAVRAEPPREEGGGALEAAVAAILTAIDNGECLHFNGMAYPTHAIWCDACWGRLRAAAARAPGPVGGEA